MKSVRMILTGTVLVALVACGGGSGGSDDAIAIEEPAVAGPSETPPTTTPANEKVKFSELARDMLAVPESEEPWDISQFDIEMDIDANAEPTQFDDLFNEG